MLLQMNTNIFLSLKNKYHSFLISRSHLYGLTDFVFFEILLYFENYFYTLH